MMMSTPQDDERPRTHPAPHSTAGTSGTPSDGPSPALPSFTPRWGRLGVALVGLAALAAAPVALVLAMLGVVSLLVPLAFLAVTAGAVAVLRLLAARSRRARVDRAFLDAMAPVRTAEPAALPAPVAPAAPRRPTALFDAEETSARRLTAMELRTAALAVAHGSTVLDVRSDSGQAVTARTAGPAGAPEWAPVQLPRPTYVDAAKAERQAPAPLDLPEAPKPVSRTPIKASEAAARIAAADTTADGTADAAPATGRINLDDVLQRRRA